MNTFSDMLGILAVGKARTVAQIRISLLITVFLFLLIVPAWGAGPINFEQSSEVITYENGEYFLTVSDVGVGASQYRARWKLSFATIAWEFDSIEVTRSCTDIDADGYSVDGGECGPIDCDDSNAAIHPGAEDICGNGRDEDCSGSDRGCAVGSACGNSGATELDISNAEGYQFTIPAGTCNRYPPCDNMGQSLFKFYIPPGKTSLVVDMGTLDFATDSDIILMYDGIPNMRMHPYYPGSPYEGLYNIMGLNATIDGYPVWWSMLHGGASAGSTELLYAPTQDPGWYCLLIVNTSPNGSGIQLSFR